MTRDRLLAVALLAVLCATHSTAQRAEAYEGDPSLRGATVQGIVTFMGSIPKVKRLPVHRNSAVCGATMPDEGLSVDPTHKGIRGVIVSLEGITRGKPLPEDPSLTIENRTCRFFERANAAVVGSRIEIKNADPILHNTHIRRESRFGSTLINVAQPVGARTIEKHVDDTGVLDVRCDAHTFMRASIHVFGHPYFAVTDQAGHFELTHVPPGTYRMLFWHEVLDSHEQDLTVPDSGSLSVDIQLE